MTKTNYKEVQMSLSDNKKEKLKHAAEARCAVKLNFKPEDINTESEEKLFFTDTQIKKMNKAFTNNKGVNITFSSAQVKYNVKHGGFLGALLGLARGIIPAVARIAPAIAKTAVRVAPKVARVATPYVKMAAKEGAKAGASELGKYAVQKVTDKVKKALGDGLFIKHGGTITQVELDGEGLYLKPRYGYGLSLTPHMQPQVGNIGDGLFLLKGSNIQNGQGVIEGGFLPFLLPALAAASSIIPAIVGQ